MRQKGHDFTGGGTRKNKVDEKPSHSHTHTHKQLKKQCAGTWVSERVFRLHWGAGSSKSRHLAQSVKCKRKKKTPAVLRPGSTQRAPPKMAQRLNPPTAPPAPSIGDASTTSRAKSPAFKIDAQRANTGGALTCTPDGGGLTVHNRPSRSHPIITPPCSSGARGGRPTLPHVNGNCSLATKPSAEQGER